MTVKAKQLLQEALRLSEEERGDLAAELLDSLDDGVDEDWESAWAEEIRKRLDDLESGKAKTVPWEEVRRKLRETIDAASKRRVSRVGGQRGAKGRETLRPSTPKRGSSIRGRTRSSNR